jgi:hypothetical protein
VRYVTLALGLAGCILVPFLLVWANTNLRTAVRALKGFGAWMSGLMLIGALTWLAWFILPPLPG